MRISERLQLDPEPSRKRQRRCPLTFLLLVFIFSACGGGSGGSGNDADPAASPGFSVSGMVNAPANAGVDWDVNDPNATNPNASNDALSQTQLLFPPLSLAGHVNRNDDASDFYGMAMQAGYVITLYIADRYRVDLDLFLYDTRGQIVDSAMGDSAVESLEIAADGDYILEVRIVDSGFIRPGSNYNLVIGPGRTSTADIGGMRLSDAFVPGEVIVRFFDDAGAINNLQTDRRQSRARSLGMQLAGGGNGSPMLMKFNSQDGDAAVFRQLGIASRALDPAAAMIDHRRRGKLRTLDVIKSLRQRDDVRYAEPNYIRKAFATPDDTFFNLQWHYEQIGLPRAWDVTTGSDQVIVAVVDSGVLTRHPDLKAKLTGTGYDFVSDVNSAGDGDGIDADPDDPGDQANQDGSSSFHGTHVAGTIAAATQNKTGGAGAGWQTRVMAIRALGLNGQGTDYDVAQGIRYAAGLSNDSGRVPAPPADIINLSLGGRTNSQLLAEAVQAARDQGVIIIAAAGNNASSQPTYPAANAGVVSVSAVDFAADLAFYSNYGDTIDVAAPGGDTSKDLNADGYGDGILSTLGDDSSGTIQMVYGFYQGTSMATPHVASVAALMKAVQPALTPDDFDLLLDSGALTTAIGSEAFFGAGLIDAQKAVLAVQSGESPVLLSVDPGILGLGIALTSEIITAAKTGNLDKSLSITSISTDVSWLTVTPETLDADGLGTYRVTVDRDGLVDGGYNGMVTFVSTENTVDVPVSMQVSTAAGSADAGFHYILLVDAATGETVYQAGVAADNGAYPFDFNNVAEGVYLLYAGTDLDNDNQTGDAGEAIGAYLSLEQPQELIVDRDISGLDFVSEFNIKIGQAGSSIQQLPEVPLLLRLPQSYGR
jgi:serine protease